MTQIPVKVVCFPSQRTRRPPSIASRALTLRTAVAFHRDHDAMRIAQALALGLRQFSNARRDRPAFLHGAMLDRAVRALEEAVGTADPAALAEAREWLYALATTIGRTWGLREGNGGPLDDQERTARRAVHGGAALLAALECCSYGEAVVHAERLAHELASAQRGLEAAQLLDRAEGLETRLERGGRGVAAAADALEAAAVRALGAVDPSDLARSASVRPSALPGQVGRHAGRGLIAFAMHDPEALADEALMVAAHLRAPECLEAGWGPVAEDLLNREEGLRAAVRRREVEAVHHASERVEAVLAWLEALALRQGEEEERTVRNDPRPQLAACA